MKGVRFFGDGIRTTSLVMQTTAPIRFIDSIHVKAPRPTVKIRSDSDRRLESGAWRRTSRRHRRAFVGFTGFTLVMPFPPLYPGARRHRRRRSRAVDRLTLGVTPAMTAHDRAALGPVGDRFGSKIMVERSLVSFIVAHGRDGLREPEAWHLFALRAVQGLFAGYRPA